MNKRYNPSGPEELMGEAMLGGKSEVSVSRIGRRSFLRSLAADATLLAAKADSTIYEVGVGWGTHPYWTTLRAVAATGQWPAARIAGHTVVIKTNLVSPKPSTSGATTDPQVVRALVDMALYAGASQVQIVEASLLGKVPRWAACGYTFFHTYNPRVSLVDLTPGAYNYTPVLNGYAYQYMYVSSLVVDPNIVFISAAKLKTHVNAVATLSMKNLFGLADQTRYHVPNHLARQDCHSRGVDLTIMDLNLIRPIHFAVIDGIWGMEGQGPIAGTPVASNVVLAGANPVAVDRVGLQVMEIPQTSVPHLTYASNRGLGPVDLSNIRLLGDRFIPIPFTPAVTAPVVWQPQLSPVSISLSAGEQTSVSYAMPVACFTRVEIIHDDDANPAVTPIRILRDWGQRPAGVESLVWDATDDNGNQVSPGSYLVRVQGRITPASQLTASAVNLVSVEA